MIPQNILEARQFVAGIDLTGVPTHSKGEKGFAPQLPSFIPRADEAQSIVIGSQLQTFAKGVDARARRAIQNSTLLAQLAALKKAAPDDFETWHRTYFEVLSSVGWLIREWDFQLFDSKAVQGDVHAAILQLAAGLMGGPATSAFQLVAATINALQKLGEESQAIKIFSRETRREQAARFQLSTAEKEKDGGVSVSLMAFRLYASATTMRVLFFKFKSEDARLEHFTAKIGLNQDTLEKTSDLIAKKVAGHINGYVKMLEI